MLDALEQALHQRRPVRDDGLAHRSDRGSQHLALRCTDRLAEAGVQPSAGSVGGSCGNALAETINGLFKAASAAAEADRNLKLFFGGNAPQSVVDLFTNRQPVKCLPCTPGRKRSSQTCPS